MSASPYDRVRVKDPITGAHITVSRATAKANDLTVLEKVEAVDADGRPLAPKPETDKAGNPTTPDTKSTSGSAGGKKES